MRREVRRIAGPMEWRSLFPRARISFFKCTTWRTRKRRAIRRASDWCSRNKPPKQRVLTLQLTNDHFVIPPGATIIAWKLTAHCRMMRCCSVFFRTCICAENDSSTTSFSPDGTNRAAVARELRFLLADELPAGEPLAAEGGNRAASGRRGTTIRKTIRIIPIQTQPFTGAIRLRMK